MKELIEKKNTQSESRSFSVLSTEKCVVNPTTTVHKSVLLKEIIEGLSLKPGDTYLDCTINAGGHAKALAQTLEGNLRIIGFDQDSEGIARAKHTLKNFKDVTLVEANFRTADTVLQGLSIGTKLNGALFDLGLSSDQLETSQRGFSFKEHEPLSMTMSPGTALFTASHIANEWEADSIASIIKGYGEERYARNIARAIVKAREVSPIRTSLELASIIKAAVPAKDRYKKIHPATKTFQAFRIAINDELESLREGLDGVWKHITPGGRLAVVSFHSLEDRIVKHWMLGEAKIGAGRVLTKRPLIGSEVEIKENPRARSAKLRLIEKY